MNALAEYMRANGMRNEDAAKALGVSQWHVSRLRHGLLPSMSLARRIARWTDGAVPVQVWDDEAA